MNTIEKLTGKTQTMTGLETANVCGGFWDASATETIWLNETGLIIDVAFQEQTGKT